MRLTASNDARHEEERGEAQLSLSYDAAVTSDQSGRCRQAATHSRGNDTALLLWERLTECSEERWGGGVISFGFDFICCFMSSV